MVDCNQGWRLPWDTESPWTFKDALAVARELERLGVYWMEEPLHRADRDGMRALRQATAVRIAAGEMTRQLHELRDLITGGCVDVLQPDAALVGGITGLRRMAVMAQEHHVTFTPHTWTNGMGVTANAHLVAGLADAPFMEFPFDPPGVEPRAARLPDGRAPARGRPGLHQPHAMRPGWATRWTRSACARRASASRTASFGSSASGPRCFS